MLTRFKGGERGNLVPGKRESLRIRYLTDDGDILELRPPYVERLDIEETLRTRLLEHHMLLQKRLMSRFSMCTLKIITFLCGIENRLRSSVIRCRHTPLRSRFESCSASRCPVLSWSSSCGRRLDLCLLTTSYRLRILLLTLHRSNVL
jgi:hypothetical protein